MNCLLSRKPNNQQQQQQQQQQQPQSQGISWTLTLLHQLDFNLQDFYPVELRCYNQWRVHLCPSGEVLFVDQRFGLELEETQYP